MLYVAYNTCSQCVFIQGRVGVIKFYFEPRLYGRGTNKMKPNRGSQSLPGSSQRSTRWRSRDKDVVPFVQSSSKGRAIVPHNNIHATKTLQRPSYDNLGTAATTEAYSRPTKE